MKVDDLGLLRELHHDKMSLYVRHVAVARLVTDYEFNNAYQYVINREDTHLRWLESSIVEFGGTPEVIAEPTLTPASGKGNDKFLPLVRQDAAAQQELVDKWKPRAGQIRSERHRKMVTLMLGESLEQKRFFEHMLEGQDDLLGRRMAGASTGDGVMPVRWVE